MSDFDLYDHSWKYFDLHAKQRMTVFQFYLAAMALIISGLATYASKQPEDHLVLLLGGVFLMFLSSVFWLLDRRTRNLIRLAEGALRELELSAGQQDVAPFSRDQTSNPCLTYSVLLRTTYCLFIAVGLGLSIYAIVQ